LRRPVAKPDLVGSPDQAKVHPNPFSSKFRTSPEEAVRLSFEEGVAHAGTEGKDPEKSRQQPLSGVVLSMAVTLENEFPNEEN